MSNTDSNGNGTLESAMKALAQSQASLVQTQATFVQNQALFQAQLAESARQIAETDREMVALKRDDAILKRQADERFSRIETLLIEHGRILEEDNRLLDAMAEAIRDKIGFKPTPR